MTFACVRSAMGALLLALATCHGVALAQAPGEADLVPAPADPAPASPAAPPPLAAALEPAPAEMVLAHGDPIARSGSSSTAKGPGGLTWGEVPALETLGPAHALESAASAWQYARSPVDSGTAGKHRRRGEALMAVGDHRKALAEFDAALEAERSMASTHVERGWAELTRRHGDLNAAMAEFVEALLVNPGCSRALVGRGYVRLKRHETDVAIAEFDEAIRLYPGSATGYLLRGVAWSMRRDLERAIADYATVVRLEPRDRNVYLLRGSLHLELKQYEKAIDDFSAAIANHPNDARGHARRGQARMDHHDYQAALADLDEAVRLDPENVEARRSLARLLATCPDPKLRDGKKAIKDAQTLCALDHEEEATNLQTLAAAHAEAGEFEKAIEVQARANALLTDDEERNVGESRLRLYRDHKPYRPEG